MSFSNIALWLKRITVFVSFGIVCLILWNTYIFFQKFKYEERAKMEIFAAAIKEFESNTDLNASFNVERAVLDNIKGVPTILTDAKGNIVESHNLDPDKEKNPTYLKRQLALMKKQNQPIEINYLGITEYVYYRNSDLLTILTYYPLALFLILVLFLMVIYLFLNTEKISEQNKLWTGMAKETAHQIGTPLSSLLGWIAILKMENVNDKYITEIEKDVHRLNTIANRFSKIGSLPTLKEQNIVVMSKTAFDYLESRSSKQISFYFTTSQAEIIVDLNTELFSWVIENLIKNAIDAMQGKGSVTLMIETIAKKVKITISDTGKGLPKGSFKKIFKPGYTTKKRGWGLGLSLSKRIIQDYHNGRIFVQKSELGKGTTFEILLNKA